jgi:hypothetical protein
VGINPHDDLVGGRTNAEVEAQRNRRLGVADNANAGILSGTLDNTLSCAIS